MTTACPKCVFMSGRGIESNSCGLLIVGDKSTQARDIVRARKLALNLKET